jgi:hypothetical protein
MQSLEQIITQHTSETNNQANTNQPVSIQPITNQQVLSQPVITNVQINGDKQWLDKFAEIWRVNKVRIT